MQQQMMFGEENKPILEYLYSVEPKGVLMYSMNREKYLDDRNLNREQRRALEKAHKILISTYPDELTKVSENDPDIPYSSHPEDITAIYRNKKFTVIVWKQNRYCKYCKFTVSRNEWSSKERRYLDNITWDEIMEIKRAIGLGETQCWEYFPKDSEVVNEANLRHIFFD